MASPRLRETERRHRLAPWPCAASSIQHRNRGLGWEYGETRPSEEFRIAYYREFDNDAEFERALTALRTFLGGDEYAAEVECVSAYDDLLQLPHA